MNNIKKYPWVFWIKLSIRKDLFSYWWKTRGSNCIEFQAWIFKISIGMPWVEWVLKAQIHSYGTNDLAKKANDDNILGGGILIGKYK